MPGTAYFQKLLTLLLCSWLTILAGTSAAKTVTCALVVRNGYYQAIDSSGRIVADSLRPAIHRQPFLNVTDEGMFVYVRGERMGFKDHHNRIAVPAVYQWLPKCIRRRSASASLYEPRFRQGLAIVVSPGDKFGIVDQHGTLIADTVFDYIAPPDSGVYAARRNDTLYLLDRRGQNLLRYPFVTDPKLYPYPAMHDGRLCVMVRAGGIPYQDFSGITLQNEFSYSGGMLPGRVHSYKAGFVDRAGVLVIDTMFKLNPAILGNSEADLNHAVASGQMCGSAIYQRSKMARPADPYYRNSDWYVFGGGRCLVWDGREPHVIDLAGRDVFRLREVFTMSKADRILNLNGHFLVSRRANPFTRRPGAYFEFQHKLYNRDGEIIIPEQYHNISTANSGFFLVTVKPYGSGGGELFYADSLGRECFGRRFALAEPFNLGVANVGVRDSTGGSISVLRIDTMGRTQACGDGWERCGRDGRHEVVTGPRRRGDTVRMGIRTTDGEWIVPPVPRILTLPACGLIGFAETDPQTHAERWGYMDMTGRTVIAPHFQAVLPFQVVEIPDPVRKRRWRLFRPSERKHRHADTERPSARPE